ncbi:agamous-like MADS-box protein AGL11 [Medicago truncatula]|uniref:MADS-box transcription factor family protein n=1 Tax=Medicago truncatula TaxID=3880 RepID=Q2HRQ1_MEDTR|nr:agamous-like MADS-box protein AGL11 [Medicago truncatula]ABD33222.1 Transcription factor, MADS-box [Medicago truncatula]AES65829.1 MADS-box transcription factor family protein [Medicago truncatula]
MGRGKLTIKHIQDWKARKSSFNQRSNGLAKKVSEFSSKFGVEACLIVYDGDGRLLTWPQNSIVVQSILKTYELQKIETTPKIFDVKDYFANKKNKVEGEISKVHKEIVMKMYPTWHPCFMNMDGEQLKTFIGILDAKIQACNHKISMLKKMQQRTENGFMLNTTQMQNVAPKNVVSTHLKPLSDTNRLGEVEELDDFMDWANQVLDNVAYLDDPVTKPGQEWETQFMDFDALPETRDGF